MRSLLLGAAFLVAVLLAIRWFVRANPAHLARTLTISGGILALLAAAVAMARGGLAIAAPLAMLGLWLPVLQKPKLTHE